MAATPAHAWMDQGGTFTDVVRVSADGRATLAKVWSDRVDLAAEGGGAASVRRGTTVATNALLERTGAPVLLVTTTGFEDLAALGDQARAALFRLAQPTRRSLASEVIGLPLRIFADGRVEGEGGVDAARLAAARARGIEAVAVVLVHGPRAPAVEAAVAAQCREAGFRQVSVGHEIAPSRGFRDRLWTTLADAALSPLLPRAAGEWMQSDGGLATEDGAGGGDWWGSRAVLSGPAGGVVAVAEIARRIDLGPTFGLDMGGTSTDVCRVDGDLVRTDHLVIDGMRLRVPAVALETVAAGGGSRLQVRAGAYAVGPDSAGADPGPAAYGRGGPAALTDGEAVLGRLVDFPPVCGPGRDAPVDVAAARAAIGALDPHRPVEEVAAGFRDVAHEVMASAVRSLAAREGVDPAAHALVAFGGAGPAHGCGVARRLGIRTVVVPELASALSAVGIGLARRRIERVFPVVEDPSAAHAAARAWLEGVAWPGARVEARAATRYRGAYDVLEVIVAGDEAPVAAFHRAHAERFGFARPDHPVEVVELRVSVEGGGDAPWPRLEGRGGARRTARAWFGGWREVPVVPLAAASGTRGPALLVGAGTTVALEDGWVARHVDGMVILEDEAPSLPRVGAGRHPVHLAVFAARVRGIAEQMGERLARSARSVSIRERRDFSCAVFDADGRLVVNAPHVPVHLGAMGETVRALLRRHGDALEAGQAWACNDPYGGGSHLPDITVTMPVFVEGERLAFVACRGHHVDVGGSAPGSMPPDARHIAEEGVVIGHHCLVDADGFHPPALPGAREPDVVAADLLAQVAACRFGAAGLVRLVDALGAGGFAAQCGHLLDAAEEAVVRVLATLPGRHRGREVLDDGLVIDVELAVAGGRATLRIDAPAHAGNRNAPTAVARAALLYVFRCLVDDDLPLNEGALAPFDLAVTPGGLFDPRWPRAVAGGNVETSQRLVDALLQAVGAAAAGQGTMNNVTVGCATGAWYETIGGGMGAGPGFRGADAVQVHMTNTRATDVEELEARFPVVLEAWRRRRGSGGVGRWRGGDGTEKVWRFLAPSEIALLVERRVAGAPGAAGGADGVPGSDERDVGAGWEPCPPRWTARVGDRLRVRTPGGGGWGRGHGP